MEGSVVCEDVGSGECCVMVIECVGGASSSSPALVELGLAVTPAV